MCKQSYATNSHVLGMLASSNVWLRLQSTNTWSGNALLRQLAEVAVTVTYILYVSDLLIRLSQCHFDYRPN